MQMREKAGMLQNTAFFQWCEAPEGRKVGSLKRRVRSQLARWEMKNCTPFWRGTHFQVKMYKTHHGRTTFGSWCRKSARRCGAKHISKSKCRKHTSFGPLLEVEMSKKCAPLWREAHFEVKVLKTGMLIRWEPGLIQNRSGSLVCSNLLQFFAAHMQFFWASSSKGSLHFALCHGAGWALILLKVI